jgi:predicted Zn-dependent protease
MRIIYYFLCFFLCFISCEEGSRSNNKYDVPTSSEKNNWTQGLNDLKNEALEKGRNLSKQVKEKWNKIEINGFSVDDDIKMGKQLYDEIHSSPDYKIVSKEANPKVYEYIENIKQTILTNGDFRFRNKFDWKITILNDDNTINAFCAPGGYIFVYTGILKYLDNEAELAGVLAHEMGHAERRHGTRQMTKTYGIKMLLDFIFRGENSQYFEQVIGGLLSLRYSRAYEREADECSVNYLCNTSYQSDGAAGFFEKIVKEEGARSEELLSTHPDPSERINNFHSLKKELNCQGTQNYSERYRTIKKLRIR